MSLIRNIIAHYRTFIQHPNFRGPNFNWIVPLRMAWSDWKCTRPVYFWERKP